MPDLDQNFTYSPPLPTFIGPCQVGPRERAVLGVSRRTCDEVAFRDYFQIFRAIYIMLPKRIQQIKPARANQGMLRDHMRAFMQTHRGSKARIIAELASLGWHITPSFVKGLGLSFGTWSATKKFIKKFEKPYEWDDAPPRVEKRKQSKIKFPSKKQKRVHPTTQLLADVAFGASKKSLSKSTYTKQMPYRRKGYGKSGMQKRRRYKKKRQRRSRSFGLTKKIKRQIRNIAKRISHESLPQETREIDNHQYSSPVNTASYNAIDCLTRDDVDNLLNYTYPTIDGGTIDWKDLSSTNSDCRVYFTKGSYLQLWIRNNFDYPVTMKFYPYKCADSTNVDAETEMTNKFQETQYSVAAPPLILGNAKQYYFINPSDVKMKDWKRHGKAQTKIINPSEECKVSFPLTGYYDYRNANDQGTTYIAGCSHSLLIKQYGHPSHGKQEVDAQGLNTGLSDTKVDVISRCNLKYKLVTKDEIGHIKHGQNLDRYG
ncbi:hypothetical protein [Circoviridae 13 LDMD-2013]|uniref:hypothetical protein n=1 Tax=Circoviridae 13 LDMD-2013 TaxID=1379717 RepID=UPI000384781F|nr:hypothetical protein [Circoviridae 13 LDMD-2013]AGS36219.1 hypothetical protein [Circoviridae 13 LDMD-2013]